MAARQNPDLLSALRAMQASQAQYKGSYNAILPHLTLSNSYTDSSSNGFAGSGSAESKIWNAQGAASLDLIDFGQWASIESFAAAAQQSEASAEVASSTVLLNLYKAFTAVLYAQDAITVDTKIRDTWRDNAQMIALRYDSGTESKGNKMNTQASLLQAEAALTQDGRNLEFAQQQLGQVLGFDHYRALSTTGTWDVPSVPTPQPNFEQLAAGVPPMRVQEAVVQQARAALRSAHSTLWPNLSLSYSKGLEGGSEFPSDPYWSFSGVLSYPLFGGGLTSTYYASQAA
ncbi:MAG TPA: TolC family protein, partial [Elusimicrobiota bacterium]|nr:TolC family protein [Elusimicrobiota bacterium]